MSKTKLLNCLTQIFTLVTLLGTTLITPVIQPYAVTQAPPVNSEASMKPLMEINAPPHGFTLTR